MELLTYLVTGALAGLMAGLLGIGGGLVIVPALALLFAGQGFAADSIMHFAVGSSLATIVPPPWLTMPEKVSTVACSSSSVRWGLEIKMVS